MNVTSTEGSRTLARSDSLSRTHPLKRWECDFWTQAKLRNADTDQFRHVNNAAISTLLEVARMEILDRDSLKGPMIGRNVVVAHLSIDFLKELHFPGTIDIGSTTLKVGSTSFRLAQGLFIGSECLVFALATCVLLDTERAEPAPIPEPIRTYLLAGLPGARDESASAGFWR
ncbi:acyl-CoA thioesterase [Caballeronia sp. SEWSISQ10-4 2]|uniref:acyl-CoA thioesterase n=1 Tax=Caballeronia sp. SEWSISQ10-4 2 TaxID=2937438 RepID=UPI003461D735